MRRTSRNVKRWQNGDMCLRWTAAGMLEAERQFRRVGYPELGALAVRSSATSHTTPSSTWRRPRWPLRPSEKIHSGDPPLKFHGDRDIPGGYGTDETASRAHGEHIVELGGETAACALEVAEVAGEWLAPPAPAELV